MRPRVPQRPGPGLLRRVRPLQAVRPRRLSLLDDQLPHVRQPLRHLPRAAGLAVQEVSLAPQQKVLLLLRRFHGHPQRVCQDEI